MTADLQQQLRAIQQEMESRPEGLQRHVQRVADEAKALAGYWDVDPERVELASWAHDLFRHLGPEDQLKKATEVGLGVSRDDRVDPIVLHGPIAAKVIRDSFDVTDEETLEAVSSHTLGLPEMGMVAKVILLADKFEPNKREKKPELKPIRKLARRDLDLAILCWSDYSWFTYAGTGAFFHPGHWNGRETWVREHHAELRMPGRVPPDTFDLGLT